METVVVLDARRRWVPVARCTACDQDMPTDHGCPTDTLRRLLRLAGDTVHPCPDALMAIQARIRELDPSASHSSPDETDHAMTDHPVHSRHTVPALREIAAGVRAKAKETEAEVAALYQAADEIDAIIAQLPYWQPTAAATAVPEDAHGGSQDEGGQR